MRIGIIGAGNMGGPLGVAWAKAGHQVLLGVAEPRRLMPLVQQAAPRASAGYADAAAFFGDVVVLAVPPNAVPQLGQDIGALLRGKVVIDMTNPGADRDGEEQTAQWLGMGTGQAMAQYLPGARVVKAFNALGARCSRSRHPTACGSAFRSQATTPRTASASRRSCATRRLRTCDRRAARARQGVRPRHTGLGDGNERPAGARGARGPLTATPTETKSRHMASL